MFQNLDTENMNCEDVARLVNELVLSLIDEKDVADTCEQTSEDKPPTPPTPVPHRNVGKPQSFFQTSRSDSPEPEQSEPSELSGGDAGSKDEGEAVVPPPDCNVSNRRGKTF